VPAVLGALALALIHQPQPNPVVLVMLQQVTASGHLDEVQELCKLGGTSSSGSGAVATELISGELYGKM